MSATDRQTMQAQLARRTQLLEDIGRIALPRWLTYASANDLPADHRRCSNDALEKAVSVFYPRTTQLKGAANTMALKTAAKSPKATPKAAAAPKSFRITFPTTKPQKAVGVVHDGSEVEDQDGVTALVVDSPSDLAGMPMPALLALVNAGNTGTPVRKMSSEETAVAAAWDALLKRAEAPVSAEGTQAPAKTRAVKPVSYVAKAKEEIKAVKEGTKVATAITLLAQDGGVLLSELEAELSKTGKPVSARAWLGYDVSKVVGYGVKSDVEGDDLRLHLVLPKGMKAPLAHKVPEPKVPAVPKAKKAVAEAPKSAVAEEPVAEAAPKAKANKPKPGRESGKGK